VHGAGGWASAASSKAMRNMFVLWISNILLIQAFQIIPQARNNIKLHQSFKGSFQCANDRSVGLVAKPRSVRTSAKMPSMTDSKTAETKEHETDYVVIGSGLGGLSAGALLVMKQTIYIGLEFKFVGRTFLVSLSTLCRQSMDTASQYANRIICLEAAPMDSKSAQSKAVELSGKSLEALIAKV
jgi:hypothetical protein